MGAALVVAACGADDPIGDPADAAIGIRATGCGLADRLGTGAIIADDDRAVIVTSAHTVAGAETVTAELGNGRTAVEVLVLDTERDIAVLSAPAWIGPARRLGTPRADDEASLAVWTPDEPVAVVDTTITRLLRVTIEDIYLQDEHERRAFEISADIVPGDSGAPIVAADGSVLGIVYARSRSRDGVAFAVSALELAPVVAGAGREPTDPGRCV